MVIAIDGPSGSGKTSTAKKVAKKLNYYYCDSGSLCRAVTFFLIDKKINLNDNYHVESALKSLEIIYDLEKNLIMLNKIDVTKYLREDFITQNVSKVSSLSSVRSFLISVQRDLAQSRNIIVDGRDIGTTVFPNADYKFFIDADIEVRADRRYKEYLKKNKNQDYQYVLNNMKKRDAFAHASVVEPCATGSLS